ncbi:early nodulin-75-like [Helianthus annuus]|uniref:early nodulin-75-like n=1 Tax=Helianthus annuus TaxID=4232 RepID=UPI000B8F609A|nr:early nodulin-75-like [Helianthus annuus]
MEMDDDPDPEIPPSGTPTHPIEISSGSYFHGSPYRGPDIWAERWSTYKWEYTPPHHISPPHQRAPSEDPHFQAVTPPPPPAPKQPPPVEPSKRRTTARINYPPIHEDPQLGGPSNVVSEVDSAPVAPAPPMGYENPIPSYPDVAGYNPFEQPAYSGYNYNNAPAVDPYIEATNFNALYPSSFPPAYPTGYPAYGYQYPPPPQPQPQHQQPPQLPLQQPQQQEILQRLHEVERRVEEEHRSRHGLLKGLANLIKGKKKKDY